MKERIRLWVDALRSGRFPQGQRALLTHGSYCCLGVACEVYKEKTGKGNWESTHDGAYRFVATNASMSSNNLPIEVAKWFGIDVNPIVGKSAFDHSPISAIKANDSEGWSFEKIADAVEAKYL